MACSSGGDVVVEEQDNSQELLAEEKGILADLLALHHRLSRVRQEELYGEPNERNSRAIVCANILPVSVKVAPGASGYEYSKSESSVVSAISTLKEFRVGIEWLTWPGCTDVSDYEKSGIQKKLKEKFSTTPIFLPVTTAQGYVDFCDEVLWPNITSAFISGSEGSLSNSLGGFSSSGFSAGAKRIGSVISPSSKSEPVVFSSRKQELNDAISSSKLTGYGNSVAGLNDFSTIKSSISERPCSSFKNETLNANMKHGSVSRLDIDTSAKSAAKGSPFFSNNLLNGNSAVYHKKIVTAVSKSEEIGVFLSSMARKVSVYEEVNRRYLNQLTNLYDESNTFVVVYDIGLMLLPKMIRYRFQNVKCAFVMRTPFPSFPVFRILPHRKELLEGVLGADVILFDQFEFMENFIIICERILGLSIFSSCVEFEGRFVTLAVSPQGISPSHYSYENNDQSRENELKTGRSLITPTDGKNILDQEVSSLPPPKYANLAEAESQFPFEYLLKEYKTKEVIVSYDRLSHVSGILQKLGAISRFFEINPQYWKNKKVVFIQIIFGAAVHSRQQRYFRESRKSLSKEMNRLASSINGRFGAVDYVPVMIVQQSVSLQNRRHLFKIANTALITSLRGGVSLFGLEFVASQEEHDPGVLIYSEFLGCAVSLKGALKVNPYDLDKVAESIKRGLELSPMDRKIRLCSLRKYVNTYTASRWAKRMLSEIHAATHRSSENAPLPLPQVPHILLQYKHSTKRLFIFSFNGVLSHDYSPVPETCAPAQNVLCALKALCSDPCNIVYVTGGINMQTMEKIFKDVPRLGLIGEFGFMYSEPTERKEMREPLCVKKDATATGELLFNDEKICQSSIPKYIGDICDGRNFRLGCDLNRRWKLTKTPRKINTEGCAEHDFLLGEWKHAVVNIMSHFSERTPGAYVDETFLSCVVWRYHHADKHTGESQTKELFTLLKKMLALQPLDVSVSFPGRIIVVKPMGSNTANALTQIFGIQPEIGRKDNVDRHVCNFDFALCIGSHRHDTSMFNTLLGWYKTGFLLNAYTCIVPKIVCSAHYYLENREACLDLLTAVSQYLGENGEV
jgi:trehalose 6-phosphate synthase/phosphatase